ncbi:hypothetical protein NQ315_007140 [Exocentrus adspersus]|uniref:Dynein axonemal assembly factor 1 homolog n=1 Tax=Exocentrus adspersus TaxID=1586481 RepID=A0AAV8WCU4_9CUCU|nr:hypothetical protein NQ315_007140 [Exocentrus adspersus]
MPISSSAATVEKKKAVRVQGQNKSIDQNVQQQTEDKHLLQIGPALPLKDRRNFYVRSHSTLNASNLSKFHESSNLCDPVLQTHADGSVHVSRLQEEKEVHPDRICLDRRGLTVIPFIDGEPRLRLLSLQHNLINNLETLSKQLFPSLVFLDIYDNQLELISNLDTLENLRVLLMGKNRIKKIEGLDNLRKIEVLDLHGNQITQVGGLAGLSELKVLNLAGNQIKVIGLKDMYGLESLQELNLRRNRLKKLLGFADTPNLSKLFISNNDLQSVEDISSLAKSSNLREISIDNNPVSLGGDCVSFLVSYLPHLIKLNTMQITEQVRKAAMAWRRNKESTNTSYMELTSDVSMNYRREEVISNARTNWELLRSQTKCLTGSVNPIDKTLKNLKPDSDFVLTSLAKTKLKSPVSLAKSKSYASITTKVPVLPDKKRFLVRTPSQDTENSQNTSSSNNSTNEYFKLPPILVPIINKMEQKVEEQSKDGLKLSGSLSSIGPNVDSSVSSLASGSEAAASSSSSSCSKDSDSESVEEAKPEEVEPVEVNRGVPLPINLEMSEVQPKINSSNAAETSSNLSVATTGSNISVPSNSGSDNSSGKSVTRNIKSASHGKNIPPKFNARASTAKTRKQSSPALPKDREQGGDYLIEICGRYLNIYGQGALRFVDKPWNVSKAHDVTTAKFNYVNFNGVTGILTKLKHRFPNIENLIFKETNITCIGQINALAEVQGFTSLYIDYEGNPICEKNWKSYAIFRLAHWGLKIINDQEISQEDIKKANEEYKSLSDLVLWSLPDVLLQPLLVRLRIDTNHGVPEQNAKKWLLSADPELRSVVSKEALQWKKRIALSGGQSYATKGKAAYIRSARRYDKRHE